MLSWLDSAEKVLEEEKRSLHYTEIAKLILERKYLTTAGPTPHQTINSRLNSDVSLLKDKSRFVKVGRGLFILRKFVDDKQQLLTDGEETITNPSMETSSTSANEDEFKLINAFGIYWNRSLVDWKKTQPDLLGIQQIGASEVNFKEQNGIYLLHDRRETIYIGQAIEQSLGQRLRQHISDRLSGRWDRFSWFGFHSVTQEGQLNFKKQYENITIQVLGHAMEAILIESLEPRQNRKQGNTFYGLEYLQQESPEIKKRKTEEILREILAQQ
jgi:hypothetical protein